MPATALLVSWLENAIGRLQKRPERAWVEASMTVESLAGDGGLSSLRTRCRCWAMAYVDSRPLIVAGRGLGRLSGSGWAEMLAVGKHGGSRISPIFSPESSAKLVSALVRSCHESESSVGKPAGPGWRLFDNPRSPAALFGGIFDDAAFMTSRKRLADGERITGAVTGQGNLLRPSFRDPPLPLPAHLEVEPRFEEPLGDRFLISELTIHPLSPGEWILQAGELFMRAAPTDLIRTCAAGVGPKRLAPNGVLTPGLLFEGLQPLA
jgi:hypothetical protein